MSTDRVLLYRYRMRALAWVNRFRVAAGLKRIRKLPRGERYTSRSCPLAVALAPCSERNILVRSSGLSCGDEEFQAIAEALGLKKPRRGSYLLEGMPEDVRAFVRNFDVGNYPELERRTS